MFRAFLAHHQEFLYCLVSRSLWQTNVWSSCKAIGISKQFSDAFAKLRKATISFVMIVRLSIRMEQIGSHETDFYGKWYLGIFFKIYVENANFIKI
jgi:hypothetical protein